MSPVLPEFKRVRVPLATTPYDVVVGDEILDHCGHLVRGVLKDNDVVVVTDSNVAQLYADRVLVSLQEAGFRPRLVVVPAGEASKCLAGVEMICEAMISAGLDRNSSLIALGGGVVGDLAGFAASVYFRGIPYVQIPTSVVGQVDSSVGGKTGVNAKDGKNLIGSFHQPSLVVVDPRVLMSLPPREFNEGVAEIIKHAAIRDPDMLERLDPSQKSDLVPLIVRNVEIKAGIVAEDERETLGTRALLNFGHTIGHAVENAAGYGNLLHGEAVSIGLHAVLNLSIRFAKLSEVDASRVVDALKRFDLPTTIPANLSVEAILNSMQKDKKFVSGRMRFVLLRRLGAAFVSDDVSLDAVRDVLTTLTES